MEAGNSDNQWGWVARSFHWIIAAMVIGNMTLGWIAEDMSLSPQKLKLFLWHKSIGLSVLGLALMRLLWRWRQGAPPPPAGSSLWQRRLATLSHLTLYAMIILVPISGWLLNSSANVPLRWFGLFKVPALIAASKPMTAVLTSVHHGLFWFFLALLIVHLAAALKHHFLDHDDVLLRMLPRPRKRR